MHKRDKPLKARINVWIDAEVKAKAAALAKETDRPFSSLISLALRRICQEYESEQQLSAYKRDLDTSVVPQVKITGHTLCPKCNSFHWMYGPCAKEEPQ